MCKLLLLLALVASTDNPRFIVKIEQGLFEIGFRPQRTSVPVDISDTGRMPKGVYRTTPGFQY